MNQNPEQQASANDPDPRETPQVITPSEAPSPGNNPNPVEEPPNDPAPDRIAPPPGEAPRVIQAS